MMNVIGKLYIWAQLMKKMGYGIRGMDWVYSGSTDIFIYKSELSDILEEK